MSDEDIVSKSFRTYLLETVPEYIEVVPNHWLEHDKPEPNVQLYISIAFLIICIIGNMSQLLVMVAYGR